MTISEVMRQTGLTRKAIYLYEQRGILHPRKVEAGSTAYREYTARDVQLLRSVSRLRTLGVPLSEIAQALESGQVDLILQRQLLQQQARLAELSNSVERLHTLLHRLPPNSGIDEFDQAADMLLPRILQPELSDKLAEDFPAGYVRRLAMLLYEAFLDKPLDSPERWNLWYELLDQLEQGVTADLLDAYTEFYGSLTTDQLCEDYRLRRRLVCDYASYGPVQEQAKAREIYFELNQLVCSPAALKQWNHFYHTLVRRVLSAQLAGVMERVRQLSTVYGPYQFRFSEMTRCYLDPLLKTPEGLVLQTRLHDCGAADIFQKGVLIFFDFYNNTLRCILHPDQSRKGNSE